ncbi:hypothetical protein Dsui_3357 [Azospira oryzae PS]|uniref:Uncharacterized protein n=1 Tax=Azospira oryzae (strain ATCC BAA-33 / DSM 13638 / PS) TaxID=640081 RepID=G8QK08_AZOOP|nr:HAD domain-containing protein [Azospira oryzae]AEV27687.1 hypothetical protein Dsui_3357 [Azospira oryzae PS]
MILFLDFDGVLHPFFPRRDRSDEENQLFSYLPRLEAVLREFPEWKLVITSSWRENRPWENVIQAFSQGIAERIIGATPVIKAKEPPYPPHPRYDEVLAYLAANNLVEAAWIALDDDPRLYPAHCPNLILCDDGFREAEEVALRAAMGRHHQNR